MGKHYKRWSHIDRAALVAAYDGGYTVTEIATRLQRSPKAIASRLRLLRPKLQRPFPDPRGATYRRREG